jgi:hypothetical protein
MGIQASINRLADVFEKAMATPEDLATTHTAQAVVRVQNVDDGLSTKEKVALIRQLGKNAVTANTYLALTDPDLRQAWIRRKLESGAAM